MQHHGFAYRIRIHNVGSEVVQLKGRHWIATNQRGAVVVHVPVGGPGSQGVVGKQPVLSPGEAFEVRPGLCALVFQSDSLLCLRLHGSLDMPQPLPPPARM